MNKRGTCNCLSVQISHSLIYENSVSNYSSITCALVYWNQSLHKNVNSTTLIWNNAGKQTFLRRKKLFKRRDIGLTNQGDLMFYWNWSYSSVEQLSLQLNPICFWNHLNFEFFGTLSLQLRPKSIKTLITYLRCVLKI